MQRGAMPWTYLLRCADGTYYVARADAADGAPSEQGGGFEARR